MRFGLVVPTLNACEEWRAWLDAFDSQKTRPDRLLVIDSGSSDNTVALAKSHGFDVEVIKRSEFDHGGTRQCGVDSLHDIDVCVFLTQDAIFSDCDSLSAILQPFHDDSVAAVCGRQLPRKQAVPIEAHARLYNYSSKSFVRSIDDVNRYGLKTAFISNSFAAYRVSALKEVGGFPKKVIFGEDMYVAAKLLRSGYKIAYCADACVFHSHNYTIFQEFSRYFDMGVFHAREPWLRQALGGAENEGLRFVISEVKYLSRHAFWLIPEAMLRTIMSYAGFRLGLMEHHISLKNKRKISMNPEYFKTQ